VGVGVGVSFELFCSTLHSFRCIVWSLLVGGWVGVGVGVSFELFCSTLHSFRCIVWSLLA
jgi:hypothetical protein